MSLCIHYLCPYKLLINRDMEGTSSIEWRHVSGIRTHRSVKWCLKPITIVSESVVRGQLLVFQALFSVTEP
jgi:hypothetical protein